MTLGSVRTYKLLVWLMPALLLVVARNPLLDQAVAMKDRIVTIRSHLASIRKTGVSLLELPAMKDDYERLALKKIAIASSLLGAGSEAGLYDLLMLKAGETGAAIVSVTPRARRGGDDAAGVPLSLEAAGTFATLARFTAAIENVNRLMRVEELVMGKDRDGRLTATLQLVVFRASDTLAASAPAGKKGGAGLLRRDHYRADLEKALAVEIPAPANSFDFTGEADPFGAVVAAPVKKREATAAPRQPLGLALKGILWKEPPLAILEALDGQTYIVRQGDPVNGFKVSSISRTEVIIAAPQGTYVLQQYNKQ